jgi:hypothetical protein
MASYLHSKAEDEADNLAPTIDASFEFERPQETAMQLFSSLATLPSMVSGQKHVAMVNRG